MSKNYNWVCHVCDATNSANDSSCQNCGFKRVASGFEIDQAKRRYAKNGTLPVSTTRLTLWASFTTGEKIRAISAIIGFLVGAGLGETQSIWLNIYGLILLCAIYFLIPEKAR